MDLKLVLVWLLICPVWAQPGNNQQLLRLRDLLHTTVAQAPPLDGERQPLIARLDILTVLVDNLAQGQGDWNQFFRFYQETQAVISRLGLLPGNLPQSWIQIQEAVAQIAVQQGKNIEVMRADNLVNPHGDKNITQILQQALLRVQQLENSLGAEPAGADGRYQQARAALITLRQHLQAGAGLQQIVSDRRVFQVIRSALQIEPTRFQELDQSLDALPAW